MLVLNHQTPSIPASKNDQSMPRIHANDVLRTVS